MNKVYIIEGWFGDQEWLEAVYADKAEADKECARLWKKRESNVIPKDAYIQGLCKFDVVEHNVL